MIKASVFYPNGEGARFDVDYYCDRHIPMVLETLGDDCRGVNVEKGLVGGAPDAPPQFIALGHLMFDSLEDFQRSFLANLPKFVADLPNFTNVQPSLQISEVRM